MDVDVDYVDMAVDIGVDVDADIVEEEEELAVVDMNGIDRSKDTAQTLVGRKYRKKGGRSVVRPDTSLQI
ncbi:uncharacterized protein DFL_003893 [Arthrobotrys flagrans]|uniref:Uncharacterized protein n=1 Tax=Arthrobotrys flagrans TaxID=97331 RepID=A0A437A349_ARTFL|nr:hypothetical protein DFL_003893 [Arthrobotrys flagrans]